MIAYDTATVAAEYTATGTQTTSHAAAGAARAAVVMIAQNTTDADQVSGVTYDGVAMHRVAFGRQATETLYTYIYWLDGIAGGTQNVAMTTTGAANKQLVVATVTVAAGKVVALAGDVDQWGNAGASSTSGANPAWNISGLISGSVVEAFEVVASGNDAFPATPASGWTSISSTDLGTDGRGFARQTVPSSGTTLACGWTVGLASYIGISVGFVESDICFDTATGGSAYTATGTQTTSHTASAGASGAVVLIDQNGTAADEVSGVTYGGVPMWRLRFDTEATEAGACYIYWLANVPTGTQNVAMTTTAATNKQLAIISMNVARGKSVGFAGSGTGTSASVSNPSWTVTGLRAGLSVVAFEVIHSGLDLQTDTPAAGWRLLNTDVNWPSRFDLGTQGRGFANQTVPSSGTTLASGWTAATADDFVGSSAVFFADEPSFAPFTPPHSLRGPWARGPWAMLGRESLYSTPGVALEPVGDAALVVAATTATTGTVGKATDTSLAVTATVTATGGTGLATGTDRAVSASVTSSGSRGLATTALALAASVAVVATGVVGVATGSTAPNTATTTATGATGLATTTSFNTAATLTATGATGTATGATLAASATTTTTGATGTSTGSSLATSVSVTASGAVNAGLASGTTTTVTVTLTATGTVGRFADSASTVTASLTATGAAGVSTGGSSSPVVGVTSSGATGASTGAALAVTTVLAASGTVGASTGATTPLTLTLTGAGSTGLTGGAPTTLTAALTASGTVMDGTVTTAGEMTLIFDGNPGSAATTNPLPTMTGTPATVPVAVPAPTTTSTMTGA